jgi:hypothetical protein
MEAGDFVLFLTILPHRSIESSHAFAIRPVRKILSQSLFSVEAMFSANVIL